MKAEDENIYKQLMNHFKPYGDFKVEDYYGTSMMKIKKNGYYSIKLVYDYSSRALMSNSVETDSLEKAFNVIRILEARSKDRTDKFSLDNVLSNIQEDINEEKEAWE